MIDAEQLQEYARRLEATGLQVVHCQLDEAFKGQRLVYVPVSWEVVLGRLLRIDNGAWSIGEREAPKPVRVLKLEP